MNRVWMVFVFGLLFSTQVYADNLKFFGSFTFEGISCEDPVNWILTIGDDENRKGHLGYLYLPVNGSVMTYDGVDQEGDPNTITVTISGDTIHFVENGHMADDPSINWITELTYCFAGDLDSFTAVGSISDCGSILATGTKILKKPDTPAPWFPLVGSSNNSLTPNLITHAFSDPDDTDTHLKSEWEISKSSDFFMMVLSEESQSSLTSLSVPHHTLEEDTTYYWRVRFYDNHGIGSNWSEIFSFSTIQNEHDLNGNGIPDTLENDKVDLDADGIPDIRQTDEIKSLDTVIGDGQMGVSVKESETVTALVEINSIDPDSISKVMRPHEMPLGMVSFKVTVNNPGDTAMVRVYFSEPVPKDASWYFHDPINGWTDYTQYAVFSEDGKSVTIEIKDGGHGDSDGTANGIIVDPCGFGFASWIKGKISDEATLKGLADVSITLEGMDLEIKTLSDGSFTGMVLPGIYDINVCLPGYEPETLKNIEIAEADIVTKNVQLSGRCKITGFDAVGSFASTEPVQFMVNIQSGSDRSFFRYSVHPDYGTENYDGHHWSNMTDSEYIQTAACSYLFGDRGKYIVVVWATSSDIERVDVGGIPIIGWSVDTGERACAVNFRGVSISGEQKAGKKVTFTVNAENRCSKDMYYRFSMHPYYGTDQYDGLQWESMSDTEWITANFGEYRFSRSGKYIIVVWVTDDTTHVDQTGVPIIGCSVDIE